MLSTHKAEVVPVQLMPHPNADSLSVVSAFGYTVCVRTQDWQNGQLAAYIPPDSVVDTTKPQFDFLAEHAKSDGTSRIKAKKLRGVISFGLLVPAPAGARAGDDVTAALGVTHYEPPLKSDGPRGISMGGEVASPPGVWTVKYDVDAFRRYHEFFTPGEAVVVTEKLDGANARYVYHDGQMHCGSRGEWKKEYPSYDHLTVDGLVENGMDAERATAVLERVKSKPKTRNLWWDILDKTPALEKICRDNPGLVVYGEIFGNVNSIKYGCPNQFRAFDLMEDGKWLDVDGMAWAVDLFGLPWAPLVYQGPYSFDKICELAEGGTLIPDTTPGTIREGVVVKPPTDRFNPIIGRVCLKCVSGAYLEKYR